MKIKIISDGVFCGTINAINCEDFANQYMQDYNNELCEESLEHIKEVYDHLDDGNDIVDDTEYSGYVFVNCD